MTDPRIDYDSAVATGRGDDGTTAPPVRRRAGPQGRPADRGLRRRRRGRRGPRPRPRRAVAMAAQDGRSRPTSRASPSWSCGSSASCSWSARSWPPTPRPATGHATTSPACRSDGRRAWTRCSARWRRRIVAAHRSSSSPARRACPRALEIGRTVLRRAERRAVTLSHHDEGLARQPAPPLPEPTGRPALDPRACRRAGRGTGSRRSRDPSASRDRRPATASTERSER